VPDRLTGGDHVAVLMPDVAAEILARPIRDESPLPDPAAEEQETAEAGIAQ
jgi:hypothetical protein